MTDPLDALARRVADDPFFLGSALARHAESHGLDDAGLAAALGCSVETLAMLRLCRLPAAAGPVVSYAGLPAQGLACSPLTMNPVTARASTVL